MNNKIAAIYALNELRVPNNTKGYLCLMFAIELCLDDPLNLQRMFKQVYGPAGEKCGITPINAERCMRYAIEKSIKAVDEKVATKYFGDKRKLKNSEFVASIVYRLQIENQVATKSRPDFTI